MKREYNPEPGAVERYRHAVAMKSRADERYRTAVQHIDSYECRYAVEHWKNEMDAAFALLYSKSEVS